MQRWHPRPLPRRPRCKRTCWHAARRTGRMLHAGGSARRLHRGEFIVFSPPYSPSPSFLLQIGGWLIWRSWPKSRVSGGLHGYSVGGQDLDEPHVSMAEEDTNINGGGSVHRTGGLDGL